MIAKDAYLLGREHLRALGVAEPEIEAELLLRHALGIDRTALYMRWAGSIADDTWDRFRRLLDERATGRPVHYILGEREFMGLMFAVDERVMIPRPETEVLVEFLVAHFIAARGSGPQALALVDVGTGSGCIAVSLARFLPPARLYAVDISPAALEVARANARRHGVVDRITFLVGDLLSPLPLKDCGTIDAIASNPPYVPRSAANSLPREIRDHEPEVAIFAPGDGLMLHRRLLEEAPDWLAPGGILAVEGGPGQAQVAAALARAHAAYVDVRILQDAGGVDRVVIATRARDGRVQ